MQKLQSTLLNVRHVIKTFTKLNKDELAAAHASVCKINIIRALLAVANTYMFNISQMSVKTAILNETIYMEISDRIEVDSEGKKRNCTN